MKSKLFLFLSFTLLAIILNSCDNKSSAIQNYVSLLDKAKEKDLTGDALKEEWEDIKKEMKGQQITTKVDPELEGVKVIQPYTVMFTYPKVGDLEVQAKYSVPDELQHDLYVVLCHDEEALSSQYLMQKSYANSKKEFSHFLRIELYRSPGHSETNRIVITYEGSELYMKAREKAHERFVTKITRLNAVQNAIEQEKQECARPFTLDQDRIGESNQTSSLIGKGYLVKNIEPSVEGLYDSFKKGKQVKMDEDGEWTEEYLQFYKDGKQVFRAYLREDDKSRIGSIYLQPASSPIISNSDGVYVGYPAQKLFKKLGQADWNNYYRGEVIVSKNGFSYFISDEGLVNGVDVPSKYSDFKPSAKVKAIENSLEAHGE